MISFRFGVSLIFMWKIGVVAIGYEKTIRTGRCACDDGGTNCSLALPVYDM